MSFIKNTKTFLKIFVINLIIFEFIFQILFFIDFKLIKKPDLYYNGFCDQKYWDLVDNKISFKKDTIYHPILSIVKKGLQIPDQLNNDNLLNKSKKINNNNEIAVYGSSYNNHIEFINYLNIKNIVFNNYALDSYGLDQIFLSYKLTASQNKNKTILIGFLLEDLDRSIFNKREYNKVIFSKINNTFEPDNIPIKFENNKKTNFDLYLFKFLQNFYNLILDDFDPRKNQCKIALKKELFIFFINEIKKISAKYNQKIIVVTYNLKQDLTGEPSWRYKFIKNHLHKEDITHVDSYEILKKKSLNNLNEIDTYFGKDLHNNSKSFEFIIENIIRKL
jgi:hypothetical protein